MPRKPLPDRAEDYAVFTAVPWVWVALGLLIKRTGAGVGLWDEEAPLTRLVLDVSLRPTLGGDLRDVYLLVLNLNLRRKTYTQKRFTQRGYCQVQTQALFMVQSPA